MDSRYSRLKKTTALILGVVLLQWCLLPSCPCLLADLFGHPAPSSLSNAAKSDPGESFLAHSDGDSCESCHCDDHPPHAICGSYSEHRLEPLAIPGDDSTAPIITAHVAGYDKVTSGNDPPHSGGMRLHLRWQVLLV